MFELRLNRSLFHYCCCQSPVIVENSDHFYPKLDSYTLAHLFSCSCFPFLLLPLLLCTSLSSVCTAHGLLTAHPVSPHADTPLPACSLRAYSVLVTMLGKSFSYIQVTPCERDVVIPSLQMKNFRLEIAQLGRSGEAGNEIWLSLLLGQWSFFDSRGRSLGVAG